MGKCHDTPRSGGSRRPGMTKADEVEAMLRLHKLGWGRGASPGSSGCSSGTR